MSLPSWKPSSCRSPCSSDTPSPRRVEFYWQPPSREGQRPHYLDAGNPYAFYDRAHGDLQLDLLDTRKRIEQILPSSPFDDKQAIEDLLVSLPQLEKDLQDRLKMLRALSLPSTKPTPSAPQSFAAITAAIFNGEHKYTEIKVPCLAIFAVPHDAGGILPTDPAHHAAAVAFELERTTNLSNAFAAGVPSAKVVRLPNVNHYVFRSNEAEVISSMNDFLDKLPWPENLSSGTTRWSQTVAS